MTDRPWDRLLTNCNVATMTDAGCGLIADAAVAVRDETIAWVGPRRSLPQTAARARDDLQGHWLTPALIDCHTHLVFAGSRANEFEARLSGASYEDIARAGGGILSTVSATRAASEDQLLTESLPRASALRAGGVSTIEIKSGYGLDLDTELKMLRVARRIGDELGVNVVPTCLAAHTVPAEFSGRADDYVDFVCDTVLPAVAEQALAATVDAYCESIAFEPDQVRRVFERAKALGMRVRLHADQLSDLGGAQLAAETNALSADHLEHASAAGLQAMAASGTVAVLLPGAFYFLGETRRPPVDELRRLGVRLAVATDCNPGTSPLTSLLLAMHLACALFALTPEETLRGVTVEAAAALGLQDRGRIAAGTRADLAVWSIEHPRELSYWAGFNPLERLYLGGRVQSV